MIGTYAWFLDSDSSNENIFKTANLDIETVSTIPLPLLHVDDGWEIGDIPGNNKWYPGSAIDSRTWIVKNFGNIPAKIYGISSEVKDFTIPSSGLYDVRSSQEAFEEHFIITIRAYPYGKPIEIFNGPISLLKRTSQFNGKTTFTLKTSPNNNDSLRLEVEARMSEQAPNEIQGMSCNIDLFIHAAQENAPIDQLLIDE